MPRVPKGAEGDSSSHEEPGPTRRSAEDADKTVRRDVVRNRRRVIDAASAAFAEYGLDVGYDVIAHRAGVGVGTVYRHFAQRSELVLAVFESRIDHLVELATEALDQPTGEAGLRWFLERILIVQSRDRGLRDVLAGRAPRDERMLETRNRLTPAVSKLIGRAKQEHAVRSDVEGADIAALTMALSLLTSSKQPELWRRYLVLLLDGLVPQRTSTTPLPMKAPVDNEFGDLAQGH